VSGHVEDVALFVDRIVAQFHPRLHRPAEEMAILLFDRWPAALHVARRPCHRRIACRRPCRRRFLQVAVVERAVEFVQCFERTSLGKSMLRAIDRCLFWGCSLHGWYLRRAVCQAVSGMALGYML